MIRVVIADDHPMFRGGLLALLERVDQIEVVGEATTGHEAVAVASELRPDVIVMDIQMPELNGIDATREIARADGDVAILMLTMFEDDDSVFAAMRAGARGYILKGADQAEIVRAIEALASGDAIFGPGVATRVMRFFAGAASLSPKPFPDLTDREREVLELVARGLGNSEITRRLVVSPKTVRNHVSNVLTKLCVADRSQAIVRAREAGLGREPDAGLGRGPDAGLGREPDVPNQTRTTAP
jgi:DNA-binding NarL/FixJ family response regulator